MAKKEPFIPRYRRIYHDLKAKIEAGEIPKGAQLPIERELCNHYGVERITIRHSLDMLVEDGLIHKVAGVGSFVNEEPHPKEMIPSQTKTLVFLMKSNANDIHHNPSALNAMLFFAMEHICKEQGYRLLFVTVKENDDVLTLLRRNHACGVFLVSTLPDKCYDAICEYHFPALCLNHFHPQLISILPDNGSGARQAIRHLYSLGHRRIAYINGIPRAINATERLEGYRDGLIEHGLNFSPFLHADGFWTYEGGKAAMQRLLESPSRPTAVFAASDMMAIGAMEAVRSAGLSIPQDISFIGFDGIGACEFCTPQLSSIASAPEQMAKIAFLHMMMLQNPMYDGEIFAVRLPVHLELRGSCCVPPATK